MNDIYQLFENLGIVPVVVLDDADHAVPLARALLNGGIPVMEITYRTAAAQDSIRRISEEVPEMCVGAGTVLDAGTAEGARKAGAQFIVSPGYSEALLGWCRSHELPFFPGVATASELQKAVCDGMTCLKFFPAEQAGGVPMLKALGSVFPRVKFMPTGGINEKNMADYLSLPNVLACGGSWLCPTKLIREGSYERIAEICCESVKRVRAIRS